MALHKVQSHDEQEKGKNVLHVPKNTTGPLNLAYSNRSQRDPENSTSRSIFERNTFRQFTGPGKLAPEDFNPEEYPKMLKIREEAIAYREKTTLKYINKMFNQNKISPRTFKRKNLELEQWVTKEKDEVKKTKKKFEKEWQKTAKMMEITQQNDQNIRRILNLEKIDNNGMVSTSSRIQRGSSHNVGGDIPPVTDSYRGSNRGGADGNHANQGTSVLTMIYERDADSKQSRKSRDPQRHSFLDEVASENEPAIDSESAEVDSERKRSSYGSKFAQ